MQRIFGLDLGTTSIGSAVIDYDAATRRGKILRLGVRIFPEARDPEGTPLNQTRRTKRMMRRQGRRRRQRRRALNEALESKGLLPAFDSSKDSAWSKTMRMNPYLLRQRALTENLSAFELGRAFYHLAKHRHFKGRAIEVEKDAADDDKAETDLRDSTVTSIRKQRTTLGAWLAAKKADATEGHPPQERRRGAHADRDTVEREFETIWTQQACAHEALRDADFKNEISTIVFFQRPVFWRTNTLGECRFVPGSPLCPEGSWLSHERRMLEKVNNLAIVGGNQRPLEPEERSAILETLRTQASMTWGAVRRALKPLYAKQGEKGEEKRLKFNLELDGSKSMPGNALEGKLLGIFGASWKNNPNKQAIRQAVHERLWAADYDKTADGKRVAIRSDADRTIKRHSAAQSFAANFGATPEQVMKLAELRLPGGWEPFSTVALNAFLPKLEQGIRMGDLLASPSWADWREQEFPSRVKPTGEFRDLLPSPAQPDERERLSRIRNPTVVRVQNEVRKVVNNLIRLYGKPDLIRLESTRAVGRSKIEREEYLAIIKMRESQRRKAAKDLTDKGISMPSRADIEKWLLWNECAKFDPYSGKPICFDDLFHKGVFQVEHIWPLPLSLDDSFANKTLCHHEWNSKKHRRMPYEAFKGESWENMKERVWKHVDAGRMSKAKAVRFCREESLPEDFAARQLNDTGYSARQAAAFLKRLWPDLGAEAPTTVQVVSGKVTAQLRRLWNLNNIGTPDGPKSREDHRHHAVDALVVACAHPGTTQQLSNYWQHRDAGEERPRLSPPWDSIRDDAEKAREKIVVSHRVRKKVSGPLHAEMPFGYTNTDIRKKRATLGVFVKRQQVEKLSLGTLQISSVEQISRSASFVVRDNAIRLALLDHVTRAGGDHKKAYPPYPRLGSLGPEIRKVRVLSVQQNHLMVEVANGYAEPANNHHIAIYRQTDGTVDFEVVSLFEAVKRQSRKMAVISRSSPKGAFAMSLSAGEAIQFHSGDQSGIWVVKSIWANGQVVIEHSNDAVGITKCQPGPSSILANARKVSVDPVGRVRPAFD